MSHGITAADAERLCAHVIGAPLGPVPPPGPAAPAAPAPAPLPETPPPARVRTQADRDRLRAVGRVYARERAAEDLAEAQALDEWREQRERVRGGL